MANIEPIYNSIEKVEESSKEGLEAVEPNISAKQDPIGELIINPQDSEVPREETDTTSLLDLSFEIAKYKKDIFSDDESADQLDLFIEEVSDHEKRKDMDLEEKAKIVEAYCIDFSKKSNAINGNLTLQIVKIGRALVGLKQLVLSERKIRWEEWAKDNIKFLKERNRQTYMRLSLSLVQNNQFDSSFIDREKASLLHERARGLIELVEPEKNLNHVGGMGNLKEWLIKRGRFIHGRRKNRYAAIPAPKGVLLTGPPGCGKSFLVSALAGSWGISLVKLVSSRLFSSLVGRTEQNFLMALETIGALTPCILWVEEFEKFFPSIILEAAERAVMFQQQIPMRDLGTGFAINSIEN